MKFSLDELATQLNILENQMVYIEEIPPQERKKLEREYEKIYHAYEDLYDKTQYMEVEK